MPLTIIKQRFKATEEWEQSQKLKFEKNGDEKHFYRKLSFSKKELGLGLGNLNFKVKLETKAENDPYVFATTRVTTESKETFIDFRIMIEYSAGGKSGSFSFTRPTLHTFTDVKFWIAFIRSDCPVFKDIFKANVEINVTYKVTLELELKKTEIPLMKPNLLHKLYSDGEFSDVKIICDGKVFNCHKLILSGQSEVFKKMLDIENKFVEATSGEIKITDTMPKITATTMENLIFFMYHENLDEAKVWIF